MINSNCFVGGLGNGIFNIRTLSVVAKIKPTKVKCYKQWEYGWNTLRKWSFLFKVVYIPKRNDNFDFPPFKAVY